MNLSRGLGAHVCLSPNLESARAQAGGGVQCQQVARVCLACGRRKVREPGRDSGLPRQAASPRASCWLGRKSQPWLIT